MVGRRPSETIAALARLSPNAKAHSEADHIVLIGTGTMPALIAPGKNMPGNRCCHRDTAAHAAQDPDPEFQQRVGAAIDALLLARRRYNSRRRRSPRSSAPGPPSGCGPSDRQPRCNIQVPRCQISVDIGPDGKAWRTTFGCHPERSRAALGVICHPERSRGTCGSLASRCSYFRPSSCCHPERSKDLLLPATLGG